jgi:5-methylcytosine-specific restriction endonuclease McrA
MKFYPADWRADAMLRLCSIAARGLWAEMMCIMHEAERYGSLLVNGRRIDKKQLAGLAGISERECTTLLFELEGNGVFSRDEDGTIYSRRMRRDHEKAEKAIRDGLKGGHPDIRRGTVPKDQRVRRFRRSDAPEKAKRIYAKSGGNCHWCQKPLDPEGYHIDHVVAVRDGGTNDENNLVASCQECNGERAMTWGRNDADLMVGNKSDPKAQIPEARIDRIGSAGASSFTDGSKALASAFWKALGFESALAVPPDYAGTDWRAIEWERAGWTVDLIDAETRRIGPDKPLTYYEKVFATAFAKRQSPLPVAVIKKQEKVHVTQSARGGISSALDRLIEQAEGNAIGSLEGSQTTA